MPRYNFTAYDQNGVRISGEVAAATESAALDAIASRGHFTVDIIDAAGNAAAPWWNRDVLGSNRLAVGKLALFTRELTSLYKADLPIDECLRLVALQPSLPARLRKMVGQLLNRVVEGESLSQAMAMQGEVFPEFYWRLVQAGETSGALGQCLDDLAASLERSAETRQKVASALIYPFILVAAAIVAIAVIAGVLVPALAPIFVDAGVEPPLLFRVLATFESLISAHWLAASAGLAFTIAAVWTALRDQRLKLAIHRMVLNVPIVGQLIERKETGLLARTLATLIRNGVPLLDAVRITASVLSNRALRDAVVEAGSDIKEGGQISTSLIESGLFSELFLRLAAIGERTGQLDTMLQRAADIYEAALQRQMERLTGLIVPIVTLSIGGMIGGMILTVMNALMSINDLALK
jgi:general secretion pathway protein F